MKNKLSVKFFTIMIINLLFLSSGYLFYRSFNDTKNSIRVLLEENIQFNILNIKYFLDKNLEIDNISKIKPYLNNIVYTNDIIKSIEIVTNKNVIIYKTKEVGDNHSKTKDCINISKIINSNIFTQHCYKFYIKLYDNLQPYYYQGSIEIDSHYLNMLIQDKIDKYIIAFIIYTLMVSSILWIVVRNLFIKPLEELRQYAYNSIHTPNKFYIKEIEGIRRSLKSTFERLREEQDELYHLSTKDPLSGLYNRLSLIEKINWLISNKKRDASKFAVLFLDLDNFKNINDSRGHEFGDKVLLHISNLLLSSVRENDTVSRLGGDEFVVVLSNVENDNEIYEVVKRIQSKLSEPVEYGKYKYNVTCSMGISLYPKDGKDVTTLLKNADIAMYKAKELGKNGFHFFKEVLNDKIQEKMKIQALMIDGLENNHFQLYYQPKVDIKTDKIVGCEALIRLITPKDGLIPPNKFIPIAEENHFIIPLGDWIIKEAVSQLKKWEDTQFKDIKLSINISAVQLNNNENLFHTLAENVKDIDVSKLEVELTESVLIKDFNKKLQIINKFKELGISISLDDFGTGYSSLSYLKTIPFDTIKIDKSFIDDLSTDKNRAFVNMIVTIAEELSIDVIAEGVETNEQLLVLSDMQCKQYQGYLCSQPLPLEQFEDLFKKY